MTISERIAQVRRDNNLSQEAFGDALGVSRQAISKWESGTSLPEVEKLIAIARTYQVSIAWLLDMDDAAAAPSLADDQLTQAQLRMVEEIVSRYLDALPKKSVLSRRVQLCMGLGGVAAGIFLLCAIVSLSGRIDGITRDYSNLQREVSMVSQSVSLQMSGLTDRVEEILKSQNSVAADYGYRLEQLNPAENTATFSVWATPKTYTPDMTVTFAATSGGQITQQPGEQDASHKFTAQIRCPLSNDIALTVGFASGGQLQTQLLGQELELEASTCMWVSGSASFWGLRLTQGKLSLAGAPITVEVRPPDVDDGTIRATRVAVGVFVNEALVESQDLTILNDSESLHGGEVQFPDTELTLRPGDRLVFAATLTDSLNRTSTAVFDSYVISAENSVEITDWSPDSADYEVVD